jgi:hypothetical protein
MRLLPILGLILALALLGAGAGRALGDDPCAGFKWDVSKERALFGSSAERETAGKDRSSAAVVAPDRLYQLQLTPQEQVTFSTSPGKKTVSEGNFAGLVVLKISSSGSYRISVDLPLWIDVAANGTLVRAKDYEGQQGCSAPHKIVEFDLENGQPTLLQLSGASKATVRLTVTRVT